MSLTLQDIEKLADLARLEISDTEKETILQDMNAIVGYISEIESVAVDMPPTDHSHINVTREDIITVNENQYTDSILENAPKTNGDYLEVDQVIS